MNAYILIIIGLLFTTGSLIAQIDRSSGDCIEKYGTAVSDQSFTNTQLQTSSGLREINFRYQVYKVHVLFVSDHAVFIGFTRNDGADITQSEARNLLDANCYFSVPGDCKWSQCFVKDDGTSSCNPVSSVLHDMFHAGYINKELEMDMPDSFNLYECAMHPALLKRELNGSN